MYSLFAFHSKHCTLKKHEFCLCVVVFCTADKNCSLRDLSPSLVEHSRVCGVVSGGGVCYSGDSVGSVAVYFCTDGYSLEGDTTRECLSSGLWNGSTPQCVENIQGNNALKCQLMIICYTFRE